MALAGQVTNPERLEGRDVSFQSDGTAINAYLARPREPGSYPGIIVIHEAWGVIEHIRDVARRFANLGYIALAPDLYTRVGAPKPEDSMDVVISRMLGLSDAQLVRDLDKAADLLAAQPGMSGKIGCVGFCMGGRTTLLYASSSNRLSAAIDCWGGFITWMSACRLSGFACAVAYYGGGMLEAIAETPKCPVMAHFGERDSVLPVDGVKRFAAAHPEVEVFIYAADHGFNCDQRGSYDAAAAALARERTLQHFRRWLG